MKVFLFDKIGEPGEDQRVRGGEMMHPLRKLREAGPNTPAQVSELLAANVVFHSPVFVRAVEGRKEVGPSLPHHLPYARAGTAGTPPNIGWMITLRSCDGLALLRVTRSRVSR